MMKVSQIIIISVHEIFVLIYTVLFIYINLKKMLKLTVTIINYNFI